MAPFPLRARLANSLKLASQRPPGEIELLRLQSALIAWERSGEVQLHGAKQILPRVSKRQRLPVILMIP